MDKQALIERAQAYYQAILTDLDAGLRDFVRPDAAIVNPLPDIIPFGGTHKGHDGFRSYLGMIMENIEMDFEPGAFYADADKVFVQGHEESRVKSTGKTYEMDWIHVLTFDEAGMLKEMREYNDGGAMARAFE